MATKMKDMVEKARAEAKGVGEASSRLKAEAGSRNKEMKPTKLKGSAPVFKKAGGKAKGGKCK